MSSKTFRVVIVSLMAVSALVLSLGGCAETENGIAAAKRALGASPGTIYNYGQDGQLVYQAHCASMDFAPEHQFDSYSIDSDGKTKKVSDSSVIQISCGKSIIKTVGFTTVYISDSAQGALFANSQQFYKLRIENNDRGIPLVNFAWRSAKNHFVGTAMVAQVCDQWNNPILAFAGTISGFASDVAKSTMFQIKYGPNGGTTGYVWIARGSYTINDTDLLGAS